jgi:glutaredoxin
MTVIQLSSRGKLFFLITAKPEDKRGLFEEAAGIAKYKVRREETLRKLEKNLYRYVPSLRCPCLFINSRYWL